MANRSNETSRQKRARENRARRSALEARKKAAQTPREERVATVGASSGSSGSSKASKADGAAKGRAATRREGLAQGRLGQTPVDIDSLEGSFLGKVVHVPGGMQVVMAAVLVLVLTVMALFMNTVPPEGAERGADPTRTLIEAYGPSAALFLAPPVMLVGNALFFSLHDRRRRMWTISAVMLVIFSAVMVQFVFPAAFLGYAAWRSKRIEERSVDAPEPAPSADDADTGVDDIEAEPNGDDADQR